MSDKLSDEQIEAAKTAGFSWHPIWQCLVVRHSNGAWSEVSDKLARFAALLAASPAPAITMPPLNDAMRAVLTNENCIYGTPDELYAALVKAAPAIPSVDPVAVPRALLASLVDDVEEYAGRHSFREREQEVRAREIARARVILAAPAISESEDAVRLNWLDATNKRFRMGWSAGVAPAGNCRLQSIIQPDGNLTSVREAIDAARKGEKS
ncbi:hypothetical protein [Burkholderia gladioli]|uniref:hypothetical protein n=1 Tax=Burkholderia gladioli TaxID=28095 RepID=UPI00236460A1|nr:hypothetical protein [Burkholderia gladioli]MDD1789049.1 hypothetical protein [Burkholderia gladioli]